MWVVSKFSSIAIMLFSVPKLSGVLAGRKNGEGNASLGALFSLSALFFLACSSDVLSQSNPTFSETVQWIEGKLRKYANDKCSGCAKEFSIKFEKCSFMYSQKTRQEEYNYYKYWKWRQTISKMKYSSIEDLKVTDYVGHTPDVISITSNREDVERGDRNFVCKKPVKICSTGNLDRVKFRTQETDAIYIFTGIAGREENIEARLRKAFRHLANLTQEACPRDVEPF